MSNSLKSAYTALPRTTGGAINYSAPDLTRHPPRSPRTRLGGFVHLPRLIDKARAVVAGTQRRLPLQLPDRPALPGLHRHQPRRPVRRDQGRQERQRNARLRDGQHAAEAPRRARSPPGRAWFEQLTATPPDTRAFFNDVHRKNAANREDIATWFDWLELDDYVTYGGKP